MGNPKIIDDFTIKVLDIIQEEAIDEIKINETDLNDCEDL